MSKTVDQLINEVRGDLDERISGVWLDADLLTWCNAGIFRVSASMKRATREDWLTTRIVSDSGTSSTILDETYTHSSLRIINGTSLYSFPPDCIEVRSWGPKAQADKDAGFRLIPKDMADIAFENAFREPANAGRRVYYYDFYGKNSVRVAPEPEDTFHTELWYVRSASDLVSSDSITFLPTYAYESVKAYMIYRAYRAVNHPDTRTALQLFNDELSAISAMMTPRQSVDPIVVEGIYDEEDYFIGIDVEPS